MGKRGKGEGERMRISRDGYKRIMSPRIRVGALLFALSLSLFPFSPLPPVFGQQVVDKMVATVNAGVLPECRQICLITYSDLLWQLALQPNMPLDNPTSVDLNRALHLIIDQRLILQEAEKLPQSRRLWRRSKPPGMNS